MVEPFLRFLDIDVSALDLYHKYMNPPHTDGERLAVVEAQTSDIKVSMTNLSGDIKVLSATVERFFSQALEKNIKTAVEIENLKTSVRKLERKGAVWGVLSPTIAAVGGAVLSFLILFYLSHLH